VTLPTNCVYLDTSALMRMVESDVKNPSLRNRQAGSPVTQLCAAQSPPVGLSTLTIIEFHNNLATNWRASDAEHVEYDQKWVEHSQVRVMELVASQRLTVRSAPPRAEEQAIALVTVATRDYGNGFRVWDAIHLLTAAKWAHELQASVELWTTDQDFGKFVDLFPEFKQFIQIRNLDDPLPTPVI